VKVTKLYYKENYESLVEPPFLTDFFFLYKEKDL